MATQTKGNIFLILPVYLLIFIAGIFLFVAYKSKNSQTQPLLPLASSTHLQTSSPDTPPLLIKSMGVKLDYYDSGTGRAGDFVFTKSKLQFDRLFMPFGFVIPASSVGDKKSNPQPTFVVPSGTKVTSLVDGIVARVSKVWSGDYSVQVTADGNIQKWVYETEHVINPTVKEGDRVKAGQVVAEVSDFDKSAPAGFGVVEIGILKGGNPPQHVCPFAYLDPSVKEEILAKIKAFYKSWEDYRHDTTLYNEESPLPGCLTLNPIDG